MSGYKGTCIYIKLYFRFQIDSIEKENPYIIASVTQLEYSPRIGILSTVQVYAISHIIFSCIDVPEVPQEAREEFSKCSNELLDLLTPYSDSAPRLKVYQLLQLVMTVILISC